MSNLKVLTTDECAAVSGGLAPLLAAAYTVVTSKTFIAFTATITLLGTAAEISTEFLD